jgi:hypothetical protein
MNEFESAEEKEWSEERLMKLLHKHRQLSDYHIIGNRNGHRLQNKYALCIFSGITRCTYKRICHDWSTGNFGRGGGEPKV